MLLLAKKCYIYNIGLIPGNPIWVTSQFAKNPVYWGIICNSLYDQCKNLDYQRFSGIYRRKNQGIN
ncbi:hypothetical protein AM228_11525 [Planktothricoides sp. SR001]|nr:hypothetical protein AM228_11525 [Planktothricoides sp. SR001]